MFSLMSMHLLRVAIPFTVAFATLLVYWPTLNLGFVWDDRLLYIDAPALRDTTSIWTGIFASVVPDMHYFRPLALLTFKLQFMWLGDAPIWAHSISLALHVFNTYLVTWLAACLLALQADGRAWGARALVAGFFYSLHPVLIEPVSWMSCRFDLLITAFLLLALCADVLIRAKAIRAIVVATLFLMAAFSKEMSAPFPAVLALFQLATRYRTVAWREMPKQFVREGDWLTYLLLLLAGFTYLVTRWQLLSGVVDTDADVVAELGSFMQRIALTATTVIFYIQMVFWPFNSINPLHPLQLGTLAFTFNDALALGLVGIVFALLAVGTQKRIRSVIMLAAALVALFPVLNIVPISIARNIGHERYLTFPLCFVAWAMAVLPLPARGSNYYRGTMGAGVALAIAWFGMAFANVRITIPLWASDVSLWTWAYAKNPESDYARYSLVTGLLRAGRPDVAGQLFTEPIPSNLIQSAALLEYGKYLVHMGDIQEGTRHIQTALLVFPPWHLKPPESGVEQREMADYRIHLGIGYSYLAEFELNSGNYLTARDYAAIAEYYYPRFGRAAMAYGLAMHGLNLPIEGRRAYERALAETAQDKHPQMQKVLEDFLNALCGNAGSQPDQTCERSSDR